MNTAKVLSLGLVLSIFLFSNFSAKADVGAELSQDEIEELQRLIVSEDRSEKLRARNKYRNPLETLKFFGVKQDQTVVEIWPGGQGGWYRSIPTAAPIVYWCFALTVL